MKRDPRLHWMSHEHHHALVLARTARRAAGRADPQATWDEVVVRFREELEPHFQVEEEVLLPALRELGENELVDRTLADHAALRGLLSSNEPLADRLRRFGTLLNDHVRFEERELFEIAQRRVGDDVLEEVKRRCRERVPASPS